MAAKKKTSAKAFAKKATSPGKAGIRTREKVLGTAKKQSATRINKRTRAEGAAKKRIASDAKKTVAIRKKIGGSAMGPKRKALGKQLRSHLKGAAKRARLSKSGASGAG